MVNKRWIDCRDKGFITGSTARGFSLTPKGLELAEKVGKTLTGERPLFRAKQPDKVRADIRTRAGRFVRALEESDAYTAYRHDGEPPFPTRPLQAAWSPESDNPEVRILTPQVAIEALQDHPEIGQTRVEVEGGQVGTEAVVSARLDGLKAEAMVKVISKREPPTPSGHPKHHGGLIREVKFDATAEPKLRVRFDRATSTIIIATKAPCVAAYLDESGKGHEEPQGQVLLAEMITEAVCREIARRGVDSGNFLSMAGGETDAVQREFIRLQNQYGHRIHTCFVDAQYRRDGYASLSRKGRPPRDEVLSRAVIEV